MGIKALTIEFVPYFEIDQLNTEARLNKLLDIVKQNKVVMLEGRLRKQEEGELIARTMSEIDKDFKGIELAVVFPNENRDLAFIQRMRSHFINLLLGDRQGFTIIGPANIVKEIKRDPNKIQLLTEEVREVYPKSKKKKR